MESNFEFQPYDKISESTFDWDVQNLKAFKGKKGKGKSLDKDFQWVVTEKVHGANICFLCDGIDVKAAKRTEILSPDDDFFGYKLVLEKYHTNFINAFKIFKSKYEKVECVAIYGELFGGGYPSVESKDESITLVQTGIYYTSSLEFYAFDICISGKNLPRAFIDYDICIEIFKEAKILYAEPLFQGTYEECLEYPIKFETLLPSKLGMAKLEAPNFAEGVVIKPVKNIYVTTSKGKQIRAIVKKKIEQFAEEMILQDSKHKDAVNNDSTKDILNLVTKNRLNNVISKIGRVTGTKSQRSQLVQLLVKDVLDAYNEKYPNKKIDVKAISKEVEKKATIIVDEYF